MGTIPMASQPTVTRERVEEIASDWPKKPRNLADQMMDQYGMPDEVQGFPYVTPLLDPQITLIINQLY